MYKLAMENTNIAGIVFKMDYNNKGYDFHSYKNGPLLIGGEIRENKNRYPYLFINNRIYIFREVYGCLYRIYYLDTNEYLLVVYEKKGSTLLYMRLFERDNNIYYKTIATTTFGIRGCLLIRNVWVCYGDGGFLILLKRNDEFEFIVYTLSTAANYPIHIYDCNYEAKDKENIYCTGWLTTDGYQADMFISSLTIDDTTLSVNWMKRVGTMRHDVAFSLYKQHDRIYITGWIKDVNDWYRGVVVTYTINENKAFTSILNLNSFLMRILGKHDNEIIIGGGIIDSINERGDTIIMRYSYENLKKSNELFVITKERDYNSTLLGWNFKLINNRIYLVGYTYINGLRQSILMKYAPNNGNALYLIDLGTEKEQILSYKRTANIDNKNVRVDNIKVKINISTHKHVYFNTLKNKWLTGENLNTFPILLLNEGGGE